MGRGIPGHIYVCKKCSESVHDTDNYCRNCGKKLCKMHFAQISDYIYAR